MKNIILLLSIIVGFTQIGISQILECDRYFILDLRDSTINSDPVIVFKMYTDTNTANNGSYTSLCFIHQNGDTLNPRPVFAHNTPVAQTPNDTMEYVLYLDNGFTSFPTDFNGILLMEVPYCEIPYNHSSRSTSIEKNEHSLIQLFPNPSSERVMVSNTSGIPITSIEVYNSTGKRMRIESFKFDEVNISTLESGIYFIKIYAHNIELATEKIIKL